MGVISRVIGIINQQTSLGGTTLQDLMGVISRVIGIINQQTSLGGHHLAGFKWDECGIELVPCRVEDYPGLDTHHWEMFLQAFYIPMAYADC